MYEFTREFQAGISVRMLDDAQACQDQLRIFAFAAMRAHYNYENLIPLDRVIDFAKKCSDGIDWLIEKEFINAFNRYKIGNFFVATDEQIFVLAAVGDGQHRATLISLDRGTRLNITNVRDFNDIEESEMAYITGGNTDLYERIEPYDFKFIIKTTGKVVTKRL